MTVEWVPIIAALATAAAGVAKVRSQRAQNVFGESLDGQNRVRLEIGGRVLTVEGPVNAQLLAALVRDLASAPPSGTGDGSGKVGNSVA